MRALRNIAIIALLALIVAAVPGGGNLAEAVLTTISILFLVAIAFGVFQIYRMQKFNIDVLDDRRRAILIASVGLIVLMIAGADEMLETGLGGLIWIALLALAIVSIWRLWVESHTY